jgi:glutamyl-tRNA synthetase
MIRRGLTVPALREFILSQGASKAITTQEWDKLWTINKYYLDPVVSRYTALDRDNK